LVLTVPRSGNAAVVAMPWGCCRHRTVPLRTCPACWLPTWLVRCLGRGGGLANISFTGVTHVHVCGPGWHSAGYIAREGLGASKTKTFLPLFSRLLPLGSVLVTNPLPPLAGSPIPFPRWTSRLFFSVKGHTHRGLSSESPFRPIHLAIVSSPPPVTFHMVCRIPRLPAMRLLQYAGQA